MTKVRKIAIIGCGGINSWVIKHLKDVAEIFDKEEMMFVKLFDRDVVEEKNLKRLNQNFEVEDLMQEKAESLGKRYTFAFQNILITKQNIDMLKGFDDIILGVDNNKTRQMLYKYAVEKEKYLLDMRAQGTQMGFIIVDGSKDMAYYNKKYFYDANVMERKGSCQLTVDIENDHIENGNKIMAFFGIYGIYFKHLRDEKVSTDEWRFAY